MTEVNEANKVPQDPPILLPIIPLRDTVIYPFTAIPLFINRTKSVNALDLSVSTGKQIFFTAQKDPSKLDPSADDLYQVGTIANVLQLLKLPDGNLRLLVEGVGRGRVLRFINESTILTGEIAPLIDSVVEDSETEAIIRTLLSSFEEYTRLNGKIPLELVSVLASIRDPGKIADAVAAQLHIADFGKKQKILETQNTKERLKIVISLLAHELEILYLEDKIKGRINSQLQKTQYEFILTEKMKAIQKELDELSDGKHSLSELDKLKEKIMTVGLSAEAQEKAIAELNKLAMMSPLSAEATVCRNYLDTLLGLPWKQRSKINTDIQRAEKVLEADHYGLEKIKERILEYLAVHSRLMKVKGPILCLVGPPGVGKTSLGQSIARATGRKFVRVALGGVRDEAEIRGHRKTYIGSSPGKILQKIAKCKVRNPLFMLDEVDKMAMDFRGDPASALLEVLDPEQNSTFNDHYIEVDYDLSEVMFIATSNSLDIPAALLDRMEVIRLSGYTEEEKLNIAIKYLIPKQLKENGLHKSEIVFRDEAVLSIIRYYTREAGVRNLEREIAKICRKTVKNLLTAGTSTAKGKKKTFVVDEQAIELLLGVKQFHFGLSETNDIVGQVQGLAWTEAGGDLLTIEVAVVPGKGKTMYTGQLGEVMQESIHAALTVVRSRCKSLGIPKDFYERWDIHVHVPEGATPKDGPSAGISMCVAMVSALANIPVKADVAMTGEITLRGQVLQIGGLKEKLLAALRAGIKKVIIPKENVKDLSEIPKHITNTLEIIPVEKIDQVFEIALQRRPQAKQAKRPSAPKKSGAAKLARTKGNKLVSKLTTRKRTKAK